MVEGCFSVKEKGKGKVKEPEPLTTADEQLAHLLQWLHKARVPEDIGADVLDNPVVQIVMRNVLLALFNACFLGFFGDILSILGKLVLIGISIALSQVLNELDVVQNQRDEACTDFFYSVLGKEKWVATPPNPPEAKKAHTEPSVFFKGSSTQRAPLVPYNDMVPAGDDQRMDECSDFKAALSSAGLSKPVVAKVKPPKPVATKERISKPSTKKAGTGQSSVMVTEADDSLVITTPIAFLANVPPESEAGMIKVLGLRTYVMPGALPQELRLPVQRDPHDKEFSITQQAAAQVTTGAPVASDLGSNDDDNIPTSNQCILDSDSNDNATEHCCKEQHNANARWLLAIDTEKSKLDLKHLNDTVPSHLPDSWDTMLVCRHFKYQNDFRGEFNTITFYTFTLYRLQVLPTQINNLSEMEVICHLLANHVPPLSALHADLLMQVNNECHCRLQTIGLPPPLLGYDGWYIPTADDWEYCCMLLQIHESRGHAPLDAAEWLHFGEDGIFTCLLHQPAEVVRASQATAEEPSSVAPPASAAPTEEGPLLLVVAATSTPPLSSGVSSEDTLIEESMELDYTDNSTLTMPVQPATTPQVIPSPMEAAVATNVATPTTFEAGTSGSSNMANAVSEHWADIMSNKEAEALKIDEQVG
ncbi:hypothetical protein C0989_007059 [Termitomyces sp. Mn162]|nr:hypothetical protein C0989_007059 [Termitomyces sp. Mn162]